jgi:hypothetical protein
MSKNKAKITITFGDRKIETNSDELDAIAKALKRKRGKSLKEVAEEARRILRKEKT